MRSFSSFFKAAVSGSSFGAMAHRNFYCFDEKNIDSVACCGAHDVLRLRMWEYDMVAAFTFVSRAEN